MSKFHRELKSRGDGGIKVFYLGRTVIFTQIHLKQIKTIKKLNDQTKRSKKKSIVDNLILQMTNLLVEITSYS